MSVFFIVLPVALVVVAAGVAAWVWAARSGQFDDTETPPVRTVMDDDDAPPRPGAAARPRGDGGGAGGEGGEGGGRP